MGSKVVEELGPPLSIQDDGCGFDVENVTSGRGLQNMRLRALKHGWTLYIQADGNGTCVTLNLIRV